MKISAIVTIIVLMCFVIYLSVTSYKISGLGYYLKLLLIESAFIFDLDKTHLIAGILALQEATWIIYKDAIRWQNPFGYVNQ